LESGDAQGSIADFDKALQLNASLTDAFSGRGRARFALKNYEGALADLEKVLQESATAETFGMMGISAWQIKDQTKAGKYLDAAIKGGSKDPKVLLYAGYVRAGAGDHKGAITALTSAETAGEKEPELFLVRGKSY